MNDEKQPIRIKRMPKAEYQYRCNRCDKPLAKPLEETSLYVWDGKACALVCPDCVRETDQYIWGIKAYLDDENGGLP